MSFFIIKSSKIKYAIFSKISCHDMKIERTLSNKQESGKKIKYNHLKKINSFTKKRSSTLLPKSITNFKIKLKTFNFRSRTLDYFLYISINSIVMQPCNFNMTLTQQYLNNVIKIPRISRKDTTTMSLTLKHLKDYKAQHKSLISSTVHSEKKRNDVQD